MDDRLDIQKIIKRLENAFSPYSSVAKDTDYKNAIRFYVLDKSGTSMILDPMIVSLSELETEPSLSFFIERAKETIKSKGHPIP